jgi:hypothetical protein
LNCGPIHLEELFVEEPEEREETGDTEDRGQGRKGVSGMRVGRLSDLEKAAAPRLAS